MKLVVVGGFPDESGQISSLLTRLGQTGISHRMIIYTPNWRTSLEVLEMHPDTDMVFIPADSSIDYLKQLKRLVKATPLIFQDNKTGDFRLVNLRNATGLVRYETLALNPQHQKVSNIVHALNGTLTAAVSPALTSQLVNTPRDRFLVRVSSRLRPISLDDIAYFYADNRLNFLTTREGNRYMINHSMEDLVKQLPSGHYFRISRSFIISYRSIEMIQVQDRNRLKVILNPPFKSDVFVSREKVSEFKTWVGE